MIFPPDPEAYSVSSLSERGYPVFKGKSGGMSLTAGMGFLVDIHQLTHLNLGIALGC